MKWDSLFDPNRNFTGSVFCFLYLILLSYPSETSAVPRNLQSFPVAFAVVEVEQATVNCNQRVASRQKVEKLLDRRCFVEGLRSNNGNDT